MKQVRPWIEYRGRVIKVTTEVVVGTSSACDVQLPSDPYMGGLVRPRHVRFFLEDGELWVEDLASETGTFVNGERVVDRCRLRHGDRVLIGLSIVTVHERR